VIQEYIFIFQCFVSTDEQLCSPGIVCPKTETCLNISKCRCLKGYYKCSKPGIMICRDVNECNKTNRCGNRATCINTDGGYYCECKRQYRPTSTTQFCPKKNQPEQCEVFPPTCASREENKCTPSND
ncbi:adhesion G -coupled receptor L4 isoform X2, partial [Pelobates cultripes]